LVCANKTLKKLAQSKDEISNLIFINRLVVDIIGTMIMRDPNGNDY